MADWVSSTDSTNDGWLSKYFGILLKNEIVTMKKAKEVIEESGDLREWQIPKIAAKALYASMLEYQEGDGGGLGVSTNQAGEPELRQLTEEDAI